MSTPLLEVRNLTKFFPVRAGVLMRKVGDVHAVDRRSQVHLGCGVEGGDEAVDTGSEGDTDTGTGGEADK